MGYSDVGSYGGEISTPRLDALSRDGLCFTQFYNTARCWPSRAGILTGYYAQAVRRDTVPGVKSGREGVRPTWAPLLSERLKPLGYQCYHSGKWHIDGDPLKQGFDRSYYLDDTHRHFRPQSHSLDGKALPPVEDGGGAYYSTTAITDHALVNLREHAKQSPGQPFFLYVTYTAPHFPLQAPAEDIARQKDKYLRGWDVMRDERWERMRALGIGGNTLAPFEREVGPPYPFPEAVAQLGPQEVNRPLPWDSLTEDQRGFQSTKMGIHAAMVARMDTEIGRILDQLKQMNAAEDTLVIFLSDNGASAEMMVRGDGHDPKAAPGSAATYLSLGPGWSTMCNTPFRRHKTWVHEGGISTPLIIRWPRGIAAPGRLCSTPGHVVDIVPTILEAAGADPAPLPEAPPFHGVSLLPLLKNAPAPKRESLWWQHEGNRALRMGDWKIVAAGRNAPWELYNLHDDRSETRNLAAQQPEIVATLAARWELETETYAKLARGDDTSAAESP